MDLEIVVQYNQNCIKSSSVFYFLLPSPLVVVQVQPRSKSMGIN